MCQHTTVLPVLPTFEAITKPEVPTTPLGAPELRVKDRRIPDRKEGPRMLRNKTKKQIAALHNITESVAIFSYWTVLIFGLMIKPDFHWHNSV